MTFDAMLSAFRPIAIGCFIALTLLTFAHAAPVSWDDIRDLKKQRKSHAEIVDVMKQRGMAFVVDDIEQRKLRAFGFSRRQIKEIVEIPVDRTDVANQPVDDQPLPAAAEPREPLAPAKLNLDPETEAEHRRLADQVSRIIDASEALVECHPSTHVTLIANKEIAARFLPDVQRLERTIRARFREPIASGVDLRAANIVLLENRYEYEKWTRALFKTFENDGYEFQATDPAEQALRGESFLVRGIYTVCLAKMQQPEARRRLAFAVGFQYLRQLTGFNAPDALATGFGNITETMMFRYPTMMVKSAYYERELPGTSRIWPQLVNERFAKKQVASVQNTLAYTMGSMEPPEYAEAWSLTSYLADRPEHFARLVTALRKSDNAWATVAEIYKVDEPGLLGDWQEFAAAQK